MHINSLGGKHQSFQHLLSFVPGGPTWRFWGSQHLLALPTGTVGMRQSPTGVGIRVAIRRPFLALQVIVDHLRNPIPQLHTADTVPPCCYQPTTKLPPMTEP